MYKWYWQATNTKFLFEEILDDGTGFFFHREKVNRSNEDKNNMITMN